MEPFSKVGIVWSPFPFSEKEKERQGLVYCNGLIKETVLKRGVHGYTVRKRWSGSRHNEGRVSKYKTEYEREEVETKAEEGYFIVITNFSFTLLSILNILKGPGVSLFLVSVGVSSLKEWVCDSENLYGTKRVYPQEIYLANRKNALVLHLEDKPFPPKVFTVPLIDQRQCLFGLGLTESVFSLNN